MRQSCFMSYTYLPPHINALIRKTHTIPRWCHFGQSHFGYFGYWGIGASRLILLHSKKLLFKGTFFISRKALGGRGILPAHKKCPNL